MYLPCYIATILLYIYPKKIKSYILIKTHKQALIAALFIVAKKETKMFLNEKTIM
jgi:hypothetical protein